MHVWFGSWLVLAFILVVFEPMTRGGISFSFGIGALCAAVLDRVGVGVGWQWLALIAVGAGGTILWSRVPKP